MRSKMNPDRRYRRTVSSRRTTRFFPSDPPRLPVVRLGRAVVALTRTRAHATRRRRHERRGRRRREGPDHLRGRGRRGDPGEPLVRAANPTARVTPDARARSPPGAPARTSHPRPPPTAPGSTTAARTATRARATPCTTTSRTSPCATACPCAGAGAATRRGCGRRRRTRRGADAHAEAANRRPNDRSVRDEGGEGRTAPRRSRRDVSGREATTRAHASGRHRRPGSRARETTR